MATLRPSILLVDAQERFRWLLARSIKGTYDVYPTAELAQARGYLSAFRPDVILSDRELESSEAVQLPAPIRLMFEGSVSRYVYLMSPELPDWQLRELVTRISYFADSNLHIAGMSGRTDWIPAQTTA